MSEGGLVVRVDTNAAEREVGDKLVSLLPTGSVRFEPLDVGDVVVEVSGKCLLIERKTLADLAASVADGRLAEQVDRMLEAAERGAEGTTPVVLVTGEPPPVDGWVGGMRASAVYGMLNRLQFAQGVSVIWASSGDAAARLAQLAKKLAATGFSPPPPPESTRPGKKRARSEDADDVGAARRAALLGIPRVSPAVAAALLAKWPSLRELGAQSASDLASVVVGKKSLGPKLASRVLAALA
jgi:ERCC4-type nuclease